MQTQNANKKHGVARRLLNDNLPMKVRRLTKISNPALTAHIQDKETNQIQHMLITVIHKLQITLLFALILFGPVL